MKQGSRAYSKEVTLCELANCLFLSFGILNQYNAVSSRDKVHLIPILTLADNHILWHEDLHLQQSDNVIDHVFIAGEHDV